MPGESEYSRRQREQMQRMLKNVMPDVQRMMREISSTASERASIRDLFTPMHEKLVRDLARSSAVKVSIPALELDYKSLFPDFSKVGSDALRNLQPSIQAIQEVQREQFAGFIARARKALLESLPPNWQGDDIAIPDDLESLLLDEGLPLAWVPPNDTLLKLFEASSSAERRKILGSRWRSVTRACIAELDTIKDPELAAHAQFAREAAQSLLDGKASASQALSANLLDTILRSAFSTEDRLQITKQKKRFDIDGFPPRVAIALGGIWGSHGEFWPDKGDKVPSKFSRHGSAHAVSRRQYSRINALIALMHVVALLKVIEVDFTE